MAIVAQWQSIGSHNHVLGSNPSNCFFRAFLFSFSLHFQYIMFPYLLFPPILNHHMLNLFSDSYTDIHTYVYM